MATPGFTPLALAMNQRIVSKEQLQQKKNDGTMRQACVSYVEPETLILICCSL
mgnify:CR=1 FL=1